MTTLAQYDRLRREIVEATRIDELLPILDEIEHLKLYAKQIEDQELLADAAAYQLKAERKIGMVIAAAKKAGHFREGRPKKNGSSPEPFPAATLADVGVNKKLSVRAQKAATISQQAFERMVQATRERVASGKAKIISAPLAHGAGRVTNADDLDFSPTPPWATRALIELVLPAAGIDPASLKQSNAWEPSCGEGHMAEPLAEYFGTVWATDIHDYGYGTPDYDFIHRRPDPPEGIDWIITNPPFEDRVIKFMLRALELARVGVGIFLQLRYLEGVGRYNHVFKDRPPTLVAPFVERVPLLMGQYDPEASTTTAFMWLVWVKGAPPHAPFWIPPGQRESLTRPDDAARFTAHPVIRREQFNPETGEVTTEAA